MKLRVAGGSVRVYYCYANNSESITVKILLNGAKSLCLFSVRLVSSEAGKPPARRGLQSLDGPIRAFLN